MKAYIAPIIITVLLVLYLVGFALIIVPITGIPVLVKLLFVAVPLAVAGCAIAVLIQRMEELKGGEEDAARKY